MSDILATKKTDSKLKVTLKSYGDVPCIIDIDPAEMSSGARTKAGNIIPECNRRPSEGMAYAERYADLLQKHLVLPEGVQTEKKINDNSNPESSGEPKYSWDLWITSSKPWPSDSIIVTAFEKAHEAVMREIGEFELHAPDGNPQRISGTGISRRPGHW